MLTLSAEIFVSDYFQGELGLKMVDFSKIDDVKKLSYLDDYLLNIKLHINLFTELFNAVISSYDMIRNLKSNNKYINEIKRDIIPIFDKSKKVIKNELNNIKRQPQ